MNIPRWKIPNINQRSNDALPLSDSEILFIMEETWKEAEVQCSKVGIKIKTSHGFGPLINDLLEVIKKEKEKKEKPAETDILKTKHPDKVAEEISNLETELDFNAIEKYAGAESLPLTDDLDNSFFIFDTKDGRKRKLRKASFVRIFNDPDYVSKDRCRRFIASTQKLQKRKENISTIECQTVIYRLDWILLEGFHGVARVMEFSYMDGKTNPERRFNGNYVDLTSALDNIGVLLEFWKLDPKVGILQSINAPSYVQAKFLPLKFYKTHLPCPIKNSENEFYFETKTVNEILTKVDITKEHLFSRTLVSSIKFKKDNDPDYNENKPPVKIARKKIIKKNKQAKIHRVSDESDDDLEKVALQNIKKRKRIMH